MTITSPSTRGDAHQRSTCSIRRCSAAKALLRACQFGLALGQGQPGLFGFLPEPAVKSLVLPVDSKLPEIIGQLCLHLSLADRYPFLEISDKSAFGDRAEWARLARLHVAP